jgi:hypothetical protein
MHLLECQTLQRHQSSRNKTDGAKISVARTNFSAPGANKKYLVYSRMCNDDAVRLKPDQLTAVLRQEQR